MLHPAAPRETPSMGVATCGQERTSLARLFALVRRAATIWREKRIATDTGWNFHLTSWSNSCIAFLLVSTGTPPCDSCVGQQMTPNNRHNHILKPNGWTGPR